MIHKVWLQVDSYALSARVHYVKSAACAQTLNPIMLTSATNEAQVKKIPPNAPFLSSNKNKLHKLSF